MEFLKEAPLSHQSYLVSNIVSSFPNITYNIYDNDIELHATTESQDQLQDCLPSLHNWLIQNDLLLNSSKTELINIYPKGNQHILFPPTLMPLFHRKA